MNLKRVTAVCFIFLLIFLSLSHKTKFTNLFIKPQKIILLKKSHALPYKQNLYLPDDILNELIEIEAVIDNVNNPTRQPRHDTMLVRPEEEHGYVMKPNVEITAYMLKATRPFNFDPPVLYIRADSEVSARLKDYIKEQSRLRYSYSTDKHGFRKTVPFVESNKKILIIGDSVAFGVGVDDVSTVASHLQKLVGNQFKIINSGVGGYDEKDFFRILKKQTGLDKYDCLIYIVCSNDFDRAIDIHDILAQIKSIAGKFENNIIICLHAYMEGCLYDIFLPSEEWLGETSFLATIAPEICKDLGFKYYDWANIVDNFQDENKSIFSRFALYVDDCHLSPLGNKLLAEKMFSLLKELELVR